MAVAICCREAVKQMEEKGADDGQLIVTNRWEGVTFVVRIRAHRCPLHWRAADLSRSDAVEVLRNTHGSSPIAIGPNRRPFSS